MNHKVILLGFSTAGKSTVLERFQNAYTAEQLNTVDTDKRVGAAFGGNIFKIFQQEGNVSGDDTTEALRLIKLRENEILLSLIDERSPCLIAAGPALPSRENFPLFLQSGAECILLNTTAEVVYDGLVRRHEKHVADGLDRDPNFGCWDKGTSKAYVDGRWELVGFAKGVENIKREMAPLQSYYEHYTPDNRFRRWDAAKIRTDRKTTKEFYKSVADYLGIPNKPILQLLETLEVW